MINAQDKLRCCGCSACFQACPRSCITMCADDQGFLYPRIDAISCINCGKCDKVCPELNVGQPSVPQKIIAAYNLNREVREKSSSGGVFYLLAERILGDNGVVFGAVYDDNLCVRHECIETLDEVPRLMGSKYAQSITTDCFKQVQFFLKAGKPVLFSGTPCQVKALYLFLGGEYEKLFTIDVVCHAVPSPKVLYYYIKYCSGALGDKVSSVNFRSKNSGWEKYSVVTSSKRGERLSQVYTENSYMQLFLNDISTRPSCSKCPTKGGRSGSDITIGDFWGINGSCPELNDDKGTSIVLVNTDKGNDFIGFISSHMTSAEIKYEDATKCNKSVFDATQMHPDHGFFFRLLNVSKSFSLAYNVTISQTRFCKLLRKIYRKFCE